MIRLKLSVALLLCLPLLASANMAELFNLERFDGSNPAVLTQIEDEGLHAAVQAKIDNASQSFFGTEVSKTGTTEFQAAFFEIRGDWSFQASINEAVSGTLSDPRDSTIPQVGIFVEDLTLGAAKLMSRELSLGVAYKLERYGTYTKAGKTFLSARDALWLSEFRHQLYGGATYSLSATETASAVVGIEMLHSNYTTFGWRPYGGGGIASRAMSPLVLEVSSRLYPKQLTVGTTLASNFMPQYWQNQLQIGGTIDALKLFFLFNYDIEEGIVGTTVTAALSNKIIKRYELQVKKNMEGSKELLLFVAFETAAQENETEVKGSVGASFSLIFD